MSSNHGVGLSDCVAEVVGVVAIHLVVGAVLHLVMKTVMVAPHLVVGAVPVLALVTAMTLGPQ